MNIDTKIKSGMVASWVGSDHLNVPELLQILTELINKDYSIDDFRKEVSDYCDEELNHG